MATGIDRFNEIYDNGIKSGKNKEKAVGNSEQVDRFNAMYEKSNAGYIAYKKYMENAVKLSQKIQSDYADREGQWQSAETLAQSKADTLTAFNQLGNKDALLSYGYAISDPKQRRAYSDSILSVDDYKRNILQSHDDESAFWGQWKSDDEYKKSEAYFVSTYNDSLPDWEEKSKAEQKIFATPKGIFSSETGDAYAYINNLPVDINQVNGFSVNSYRSYWDAINDSSDNRDDSLYIYRYMTDDDILRYNYIFHTEGKDEADKFISSIQNRLNYEFGTEVGKRVSSTTLGKIVMPFAQGWDQSIMGMKGLFAEGELPISPYAVAGERVRDSIHTFDVFGKDFGQVLYDLGVTTANMLPYIMISSVIGGAIGAVNPLAGKIVSAAIGSIGMGASAAGNARQEALRQGYTQEQAWAYGLTVGALEGGLQFALGGIGKLGGKASSTVLKKLGSTSIGQTVSRYIANLSNGTLSAALQMGGKLAGNMASEGFEEYLQDVINPLVRNITLGEDNEWGLKNFVSEDAIYSGILGALSAGLLEGGSTVSGVYNARKAGQAAFDSGIYKGAIDYAMLLDPECDAYQIASEIQSGKRKENAANIGALYEAVSEYIAESKKLVKKGKMTTDQYAGGVEALRQLADVRAGADVQRAQQMKAVQETSSAKVQTAVNAVSAPVLDSAVYDAVRTVAGNENSAVKAANIIARIESGDSKLSAAEISYISSPSTKARQILQQRTGIDMGKTASQARNAVKEYISQRSASQESVDRQSAELRTSQARSAAVNNDLSANLGFDAAGVVGSAGMEAYSNHYSALKTEQGQRYFNSAFAKLYRAGMQGIPFKKIGGNSDLQGMSVRTQAEIYNAAAKDYAKVNKIKAETKKAVNDRVKEIREKAKGRKNGKVKKEYAEIDKKFTQKREVKAGTFTVDERVDQSKLSSKQKAAVNYLKALSEVAGVNVNIYSGIDQNGAATAENGYYDSQTNTIYVSANAGMSNVNAFAESAILRTASHEITHMIKASGTELYVDLRDYVIDIYLQEYGQDGLTKRILDIQERHREIVGKELTYEQAEEELVASACEMMLKDSKAFEKLAKRNLTLAQRVKSALDAFISHAKQMVSEAFEGNSANSREARMMESSVERMEKLQQLWDRALLDALGREAQENSGVSYSIRYDSNGNEYWQIESGKDIFNGLTTKEEYRNAAFKYLIGNRDNRVKVKDENGKVIEFIRLSAEEFTGSNESQYLFNNEPEIFKKKMHMVPNLQDILLHSNVNGHGTDLKNHKIFKEGGFENYRGKVQIDNVIFNTVVRVGVTKFENVFYDINLEVDEYLPHTNGASDINASTSSRHTVLQEESYVNSNSMQNGENNSQDDVNFPQTSFKLKTGARSSTAQTQGKPMRVDSNASAAKLATLASEQADANTPKADRGSVSNKSIPNLNEDVNKTLELRENPAQKKFENDVDAVMNGTYKSNSVLVLGRTPKSLEAIGLNALPVAITPNHVYSIAATEQEAVRAGRYRKGTNYHGLGADAVKQIYQKLSDPIAVIAHPDFAAKNKRDSVHKVVVLVDLSVNGKQVIAPIAVDYEGIWNKTHIDVNLVASYFDKSNISDFLKEAVALETNHKVGFFYGKKERIRQLLMSTGHQLPRELNNSDSDIIIRRIDENVNREINTVLQSRQFIRWFGDWQNNPQNASKVVSEDGTPKMVYRGSKSDFAASELRNNQEITRAVENGFYFTDMYSGDNASEPVYLNIRNPFVLTDENRQTAQRDILRGNYDGIIDADNGAYFVYRAEQVKSAVDNIGTFDGKNANIRYELRINEAVEKAIRNKGQLETEYNQQRISPVPENIAKMVFQASNGKIDIAGKYFAISGGDLYHEYVRHSNAKTEQSRNQIALTAQDIKKAVQIFYQPDIVECIFEDGDNPSGRKSFAFAKKDSGYILVVESVGGRHNPNIVPVMILHVTEGKWNRWIDSGKSIAEMVYENSPKYLEAIKNNTENIKNRVTAARFAESQPPLNAPRSPRSNTIISGLDGNVNTEAENIKNRVTAARFAESQPPQNAPRSPRSDTIISGVDESVNREQAQASRYSYDTLVRKPDMQITPLRSVSPEKLQEYVSDRRKFAREMIQLARKANHVRNTEKITWLRNNDLKADIIVSADSFKHSAARMDAAYVRVCMSMSDIVRNAVAVNELSPRQDTAGAYVLLGMAHDGKEYTAVRMVVNKKTWKMEDYHILYAVRETQIKEKVSGSLPPGSSTKAISANLLSPSISIQNLLQLVKENNLISSVLSEDALQKLQTTRGSDLLGKSVLYELRSDPEQTEWEKPITVEDVDTLRSVGRKSVNEFTSEDIQKTQKWAHKFYKELGEKSPFFRAWFGDWRAYDTTPFKLKTLNSLNILNRTEADIYFKKGLKEHSLFRGDVLNNDTKFKINIGQKVYNDTLIYAAREFSRNGDFNGYLNRISLLNNISAITKDAVLLDTIVAKENSINPDQSFVHQFYDACQIGEKSFIVKLIVDELNSQSGTIRRSYNVNSIEISPAAVSQVYKPASTASDSGDVVSVHTVADLFALVKESDANFQPKAAAAALLNANGTPRQLYRWESKNGRRTNFGEGTYFTASKALAERAGSKVAPAYVKLENPYTVYGTAFSKADYAEIGAWAGMQVSAKNVTEALQALGYDGVIARSAAGNHPILAAVAFDSAQTKSSENVGTFDRANNDVRYELRENGQIVVEFKAENGNELIAKLAQEKLGVSMTKQDVPVFNQTFWNIYHKSVQVKSIDEIEISSKIFSGEDVKRIFEAAKEDWGIYCEEYEQANVEFFHKIDAKINELMGEKNFSQEIGEQGKLIEEFGKQQKQKITEYEELILPSDFPDEISSHLKNEIAFLNKLCQAAGIRMEVRYKTEAFGAGKNLDEGGHYYPLDRKVYLYIDKSEITSEKANSAMLRTASHEITHWIQASNTKLYEMLHDYVIQSYIEANGKQAYRDKIREIKMKYDIDNPNRTSRDVEEEFVAFACEMMLENTKAFEELAKQNRTLAQKLVEGLKTFIERVRKLLVELRNFIKEGKDFREKGFEGVEAGNDKSQFFAESVEKLEYMQKLWDAALMQAVENKSQFVEEDYFNYAVDEWKNMHRNKKISFAEEQKLKRGVAKELLHNWAGQVPISGKLTQVENVQPGKYETYYAYDENGKRQESEYLMQTENVKYNVKKDENGKTIEFDLGTTKYTKLYFTEAQKKDLGIKQASLEDMVKNLKIFFRCEVPVRMRSEGGITDYTVEAIVGFPAEKDGRNGKVNYEYELNKIIKEAMRTGNPVVDSTADRIFDDMVLYDVIKVSEATNESQITSSFSDSAQTQSSGNAGTFDRANSDIRYELRENEQSEKQKKRLYMGTAGLSLYYEWVDKISEKFGFSQYQYAFNSAYAQARSGIQWNEIKMPKDIDANIFTDEQLQTIVQAALEDNQYIQEFNDEMQEAMDEFKQTRNQNKENWKEEFGEQGKLFDENSSQHKREIAEYDELTYQGISEDVKKEIEKLPLREQEAIKFLNKLCQASGIKMQAYLTEKIDRVENGEYRYHEKTLRIYINKNDVINKMGKGILTTASHEITHMIQRSNTKLYNELRRFVIESYIDEKGEDAYIERIIKLKEDYDKAYVKMGYSKEDASFSYEKIEEEFVAFACETMLKDSKAFEALAMRNRTLAQKLSEGFHQFIEKIKELLHRFIDEGEDSLKKGFEGVEIQSDIAKVLASNVERMEQMQKRWDAALIEAVENRTQFNAEGYFEFAVGEWKKKFPNREMSIREEEMLKRGVVKTLFNFLSGTVPISGKLTRVENVFVGEYDTTMTFGSQTKEGGYSEKKDGNGRAIEFELGTTKYTKYYDYEGGDLETAQKNLKTFFRCEVPVKMDDGDYIAEVLVGFPAEKDGKNGKVNYEQEVNKIIEEARRTGNPIIDLTADRIFDDMVLYDVIKVRKADKQQ